MSDADYTARLKRKLVEWYAAAPKSQRHAPAQEENDGVASEAGEEGEGGAGPVSSMPNLD